ncbi:MAG: GAF domain-containing protein [Thermoplasmata archaeon]|nr:GAF domain-containing protein [Thermoplasmata archaeon]
MPVRPVQHTASLLQVDSILTHLAGVEALGEVCRFLRHEFLHFRWVGIYLRDGETLRLAAWSGPQASEHVTLPVGQGICGKAARENRTVIVDDVRTAPEYLACFLETRSEIVVPIRVGPTVVGEIDIDGNEVKAYDVSDDRFLTAVALRVAALAEKVQPEVAAGRPPLRGGG